MDRSAWTQFRQQRNSSEAADRIILSKDDPKAGGRQHLMSIDWIAYVDQKVHLKKSSASATSQWEAAA
jgi:hypothetical protein